MLRADIPPHASAALSEVTTVSERPEVVVRRPAGHFQAKLLPLYIGRSEVQTGPDPGLGDLRERLGEARERARIRQQRQRRGPATRHRELGAVSTEEHPQRAEQCTVEAQVP